VSKLCQKILLEYHYPKINIKGLKVDLKNLEIELKFVLYLI